MPPKSTENRSPCLGGGGLEQGQRGKARLCLPRPPTVRFSFHSGHGAALPRTGGSGQFRKSWTASLRRNLVRIKLALKMKAAKALGLTFPLMLLGRADPVIE
jgi:hypothetical protein